ncbi:MAG: tetratricopeptide repeat protein, partial [Candidatus Cloacimonetes bacterium]|nr:tetratricopeptide repeat protein [Candidatus Cloacimonadota bacterium]
MNFNKFTLIFLILNCVVFKAFANTINEIDNNAVVKEQLIEYKIRIQQLEKQVEKQTANIDIKQTEQKKHTDSTINKKIEELLDNRNDVLSMREKWIDKFMMALSIFIALIGFGLTGIIFYVNGKLSDKINKKINESVDSAREKVQHYTELASFKLEQLDKYVDKAKNKYQLLEKMTAAELEDEDNIKIVDEASSDPEASLLDIAIVEAYKLQEKKKYLEAINQWKMILKQFDLKRSELANIYFNIGYLFHSVYDINNKKSDLLEAINHYTHAIEIRESFSSYYNRGLAKTAIQDHTGAIIDYNRAIELNPNHADIYLNRGVAKGEMKEYIEAIEDYTEAINLKPDDYKAYYNRGLTKNKIGDHKDAISDYSKAIELKPDDHEAYCNRGVTKTKTDDYKGAIVDYDKAIELNPNY